MMKFFSQFTIICLFYLPMGLASAEDKAVVKGHSDTAIMQQFFTPTDQDAQRISDNNRHKILFFMGIALLILLISTASLGVAMVLYKKRVYVAHMLVAGLTVTLALAHAVVAMVWFYPF